MPEKAIFRPKLPKNLNFGFSEASRAEIELTNDMGSSGYRMYGTLSGSSVKKAPTKPLYGRKGHCERWLGGRFVSECLPCQRRVDPLTRLCVKILPKTACECMPFELFGEMLGSFSLCSMKALIVIIDLEISERQQNDDIAILFSMPVERFSKFIK